MSSREELPALAGSLQADSRAWHMSQLIYFQSDDLHERFFLPRYPRLWHAEP